MPPSIAYGIALPQLIGYFAAFAASLVVTLAVEVPVAALMGLRRKLEIAAVVCVNVITNPFLIWGMLAIYSLHNVIWPGLLYRQLGRPSAAIAFGVLEVGVIVVEWRLLTWALKRPSREMLGVSVVMNIASIAAGLALTAFLLYA